MCYSILVKTDLKFLGKKFKANIDEAALADFEQRVASDAKKYKSISEHPRIYPNYWAPIIIAEDGQRLIRPMRYRIHPCWSPKEIPTKYNLFNARLDQLDQRRTWKTSFMHKHGLVVFERFFEWVPDKKTGKSMVLSFAPSDRQLMWAPVLYDIWRSKDGKEVLPSFAVITTDPPPEISMMGHDRCPVFLREEYIDAWLRPNKHHKAELMRMLKDVEQAHYEYAKAA